MNYLKLGLVGLTAAEESLVATLFRLHRVDPTFIWSLAKEPPYDALLVDYASDLPATGGVQTQVVKLSPSGVTTAGDLPRPIRSDLLVRWLNSIEIEILHGERDQFASTRAQTQAGGRYDTQPGLPPLETTPLLDLEVEDSLGMLRLTGGEFKLRRWPSPALLKGDVNRIRMATMLSRRHMTVKELSSLTRLSDVKCNEFVTELFMARLLDAGQTKSADMHRGSIKSSDGEIGVSNPLTGQTKARGLGASLITSIRKRFGIL